MGKPLIEWTINAARSSRYIDRLIVSSEDAEVIAVCKSLDCDIPFIRPLELASDCAASSDVILHAIKEVTGFDTVMMLQPTSPQRDASDIDGCIEFFVSSNASSCVSIAEARQNPAWMYELSNKNKILPILTGREFAHRRQDLRKVYALNGSIYVAKTQWLMQHKSFLNEETLGYVMPLERSLDIDTESDFYEFEVLSNFRTKLSLKL